MNLLWETTDKGLIIKATAEEREELQEIVLDKGLIEAESEALENCKCNGLTEVLPEEIGALTNATILSDGDVYYSDFNYYQIKSFVEDLIDNGECILHVVE